MNELFVNVKVDREERPDIDHIYMTALHAMGEQGGWPLTMFLDSRRPADVRRHLLAARAALGPPVVPAGARVGRRRPGAPAAPTMEQQRRARSPTISPKLSAPSAGPRR